MLDHFHKPGWAKSCKPRLLLILLSSQRSEVRKTQAVLQNVLLKVELFITFIFKMNKKEVYICYLLEKSHLVARLSRYHVLTFPKHRVGITASL